MFLVGNKKYHAIAALLFMCSGLSTSVRANSSIDLTEHSLEQLQQLVDDKKLTYQQIIEYYLARIEHFDDSGPTLNAIISVNEQAILEAKQKDKRHAIIATHGPLFGMPVILKDNIETAGNMPTTAGAVVLKNNFAKQDAELVKKLKQAGAIILAKANLSEWANFKSTQSSSGWSDVGGQTKNPYVLNRTPCGSSSGSGVSVAANMAVVAIGTETDGSITCPAAHNALVGLKPTVGLVSVKGVVPLSHSQDAPGPMARSVADAAAVLNALVDDSGKDYRRFLNPKGLVGKRIGIARNVSDFNPIASKAFTRAIAVMKQQGAEIVDNLILPYQEEISQAEFDILLSEFKDDVNLYLANTPKSVVTKSLEQVIHFNQSYQQGSGFNQGLLEMAQQTSGVKSERYITAKKLVSEKAREKGIDALIHQHKLDAIVAPTNGPAWVIDTINGDHYTGASSSPSAIAGYPIITVPMAYHKHLPLGISFFGGAYQEHKLLELAYAFEQATQVRTPPNFLASIDN